MKRIPLAVVLLVCICATEAFAGWLQPTAQVDNNAGAAALPPYSATQACAFAAVRYACRISSSVACLDTPSRSYQLVLFAAIAFIVLPFGPRSQPAGAG